MLKFLILFVSIPAFASYDHYIEKYSKRFNVHPEVVRAVIRVESNFDNKAIGPDDYGTRSSYGLMQIQIETAKDIGYKGTIQGLFNPEVNIAFGIKYLSECLKWAKGDLFISLDMYNRGVGFVRRYPYKGKWENHRYVGKVLKHMSLAYLAFDRRDLLHQIY